MSDGLQDVGALATAGIAARGNGRGHGGPPGHPTDATGHDASHDCANCGATLVGPHCHVCGQMGHVHKTAGAFFHDIAHGVFHFEGKVWRTLPMLAFHPGQLTRRYIDGERVRFVSPMALFLFSVFLMFASANLWSSRLGLGDFGRNLSAVNADLTIRRKEAESEVARLRALRPKAMAGRTTQEIADYDERIRDLAQEATGIAKAQDALGTAGLRDGKEDGFDVNTAFPVFDAKVKHALENPQLTLYKIKTAAYKYSWALIPISLPFIWLLFPFSRRFGFYDHAIFATYSLSFMTLLVVVASVLVWAGVPWLWLMLLIPPVHLYAQLKGTYGIGRLSAAVRMIVLVHLLSLAAGLFGVLLGYLGLA